MTEQAIITKTPELPGALAMTEPLAAAGQIANRIAAENVFGDYRERKAENTLRRQDAELALFADYLAAAGLPASDFSHGPEAWQGITWGLVEGFMGWQLGEGYAVSSTNVRLSTVKTYCKLAMKTGILDHSEYALIRSVEGYSRKEAKRVDEKRESAEIRTRKGAK